MRVSAVVVTVGVLVGVSLLAVVATQNFRDRETAVRAPAPHATVTVTVPVTPSAPAATPMPVAPTSETPPPRAETQPSRSLAGAVEPSPPAPNAYVPDFEQFEREAADILRSQPKATFGLFVQDLDTNARMDHNADRRLAGGGTIHVDIAAELLAQGSDADAPALVSAILRKQDPHALEKAYAKIGGAQGLSDAARRFGTSGTSAGTDGGWVTNKTTARDRVAMLRALIGDASPLNKGQQKLIVDSLAQSGGEPWGVRRAGVSASKNATMEDQSVTNSFGLVTTRDNRRLLICVLSVGWASPDAGQRAVDALVNAAVANMGKPR